MTNLVNYFSKKLSYMTIERILRLRKIVVVIVIVVSVSLSILLEILRRSDYARSDVYSFICWFAIIVWFYLLLVVLPRIFKQGIMYVLTENIDLDNYRRYYTDLDDKISDKKLVKKTLLRMIFIRLDILEGHFAKALERLEKIYKDFGLFTGEDESMLKLFYYHHLFLALLFSKQQIHFEEIIKKIKQIAVIKKSGQEEKLKIEMEVESLYHIVVKQVESRYFDEYQPQTKLGYLTIQYYRALNAHVSGNKKRAKQIYTELAQENPSLFFVKEAKKYLKEYQ